MCVSIRACWSQFSLSPVSVAAHVVISALTTFERSFRTPIQLVRVFLVGSHGGVVGRIWFQQWPLYARCHALHKKSLQGRVFLTRFRSPRLVAYSILLPSTSYDPQDFFRERFTKFLISWRPADALSLTLPCNPPGKRKTFATSLSPVLVTCAIDIFAKPRNTQ